MERGVHMKGFLEFVNKYCWHCENFNNCYAPGYCNGVQTKNMNQISLCIQGEILKKLEEKE